MSSGALTNAVTVTWPAASYFHTAAGGVSSGLTALQGAIDAAVSPYPDNATSVAAMLGYGNFASGAGWGFNIASGNDTGLFGGVTMTASGTPTYHNTGPGNGGDYAIGFSAATDCFDGGNVINVGATDDLIVAWVAKFSSLPGATVSLFNKVDTAGAYWAVNLNSAGYHEFAVYDGVDFLECDGGTPTVGSWYVGIAVIDRSASTMRVGVCDIGGSPSVSSTGSTSAIGSLSNTKTLRVGHHHANNNSPTTGLIAGLYVVSGSGVATGLSANLSASLSSFAAAVASSFSVSMSTSTGLVTLSNSFWPCAMTMDDDTQSLLGFAYDFDYPQTAAQMATALGYGTWTSGAGYLCNESSGNLASVFGTPATLTASGTPTYSHIGARGGSDKAIGFDANTEYFDGGDYFDAGASDDLIVAWVAKFDSLPGVTSSICNKLDGAVGYWGINFNTSGSYEIYAYDGADFLQITTGATPSLNTWHVGIAVIDRSTSRACIGVCDIGGSPSVASELNVSALGATSNANSFRIGTHNTATNSFLTGTISALYVVTGSGVATGLSANLSTALSSFAAYMKSQTGTQQAKGVWFPDCPLNLDSDPAVAPKVTDRRSTQSPTGQVLSLVGNYSLRHKGVRWEAVARSQIWESAATYANGSFETFADDCLYGLGHAWFTPSSPLSIWWNDAGTDRALGYTHNSSTGVPGWYVIDVTSTEPKQVTQGWTGLWRVDFGDVVGVGS